MSNRSAGSLWLFEQILFVKMSCIINNNNNNCNTVKTTNQLIYNKFKKVRKSDKKMHAQCVETVAIQYIQNRT